MASSSLPPLSESRTATTTHSVTDAAAIGTPDLAMQSDQGATVAPSDSAVSPAVDPLATVAPASQVGSTAATASLEFDGFSDDLAVLRAVGYNELLIQDYVEWVLSLTAAHLRRCEPIHNWAVQRLQGHLGHRAIADDDVSAQLELFSDTTKKHILTIWHTSYDTLANVALEWVWHRCHLLSEEARAIFGNLERINEWTFEKLGDCSFHCIRLPWTTACNSDSVLTAALPERDDRDLLYHATSWIHMENLIRVGPLPNYGQGQQDFSHQDGVYFSFSEAVALDWCKRNYHTWDHTAAIAVYAQLDGLRSNKYCDLQSPRELKLWKSAIKAYRTSDKPPSECLRMRVIEGPMCTNVDTLTRNRYPNDWVPTHDNPPTMQLCIKHEAVARKCLALRAVIIIVLDDEMDSVSTAASSSGHNLIQPIAGRPTPAAATLRNQQSPPQDCDYDDDCM